MKGPNNERNETGEKVDDYIEKRLKQYLERNNKQREIYENQFVAEKSLSEIIAGKRRIKRDAQMREEYKERKMRNDVPLHLETEETVGKEIHNQLMVRSAYEIDEVEDELSHNQLEKSMEPKNNLTDVPSNPDMTNASYVEETADNSHGTICTNYASGSAENATTKEGCNGEIDEHGAKHNKKRQRGSEVDKHRDEHGRKCQEKNKKRKTVLEKSLLDIGVEKCRIERNEKRRQKYKERKLQSGVEAETIEKREERNRKRRQRYHGNQESTEQREEQRKRRRLTYQNGIQVETIQQRKERNEKRRRIYQNGNAAPSLEYDASKLIVRPSLKFIGLPPLSKRMRNKINSIKEKFASSDTILDIGCADKICCDCGALMWRFEQTGKQQRLNSNKFSLCCGNGKVRLPLLRETPPELKALLERTNKKGVFFHKCSRLYNSAFAFTSVGANLDKDINNGGGPYVYRVHGVVYHQIGSLRPEDSDKAVFSQIYMYDNQQQLEERLNFPKNDDKLDLEITESLSTMLHRENALVDIYRQVRDRFDELEITPARFRLIANRETDGRESNVPTNAYEFAALVANDNLSDNRDIFVQTTGGKLHRISVLHPCFMSLQYPLLFPYGEDGYRTDILHAGVSNKSTNERDSLSIREYYCFRLQYRDMEGHSLIGGGRLFLQFVVDAWACIEHTRLGWVLRNQSILRSDLYNNIVDSVNNGDTDASTIGKRIVLPSSFTGSPRYMQQNYQDCMAVCRRFGSPDLFITFTCNPQWPEIKSYCDKIPNSSPAERPDVLARVFKIKLDLLLEDLTDKHILGKVIGVAYTIEFQKRGLPHAHIIIWLEESDKCHSTDEIDQLICAEIPDKETDPIGYEAISKYMVHGPCGSYNKNCSCMRDGQCSKFYPKQFRTETTIDANGYPVYRRRDNKRTIQLKEVEVDNRFVVPYNRGLIVKYQAHINIEWCNQGRLIKYMFKYVTKGPDRATIAIEKEKDADVGEGKSIIVSNEVDDYVACRYLSSAEACWRIFKFPIHYRKPVVTKLVFHLENEQQVYFRDDEPLPMVMDRINPAATMFVQWFSSNRQDPSARELTFVEFPEKYLWDETHKIWKRRKNRICVVGRLVYVHPTAGERFYLRMLLNIVRGAKSFKDVRTVNGVVYDTYKEACFHHGLLECDDEWHAAIEDASVHQTGAQLRELFVTLLLFSDISDVRALWNKHWKTFYDDIELRQRKNYLRRDFVISDQQLECLTLHDVDLQLRKRGKTVGDFANLPKLDKDLQRQSMNTLLYEENMYDRNALAIEGKKCLAMLNEKQANVFETVVDNVRCKKGGLFFVYGHGGTGKTFLWKTIINNLRSEGKIVLAVASSGIAALLIDGGRTAHSRFKIPIDISENSTCDIKQQSYLAELIVQSDLIVWDEAPMNHKHIFEAVDRSIRDLMRHKDVSNLSRPFGGKTVLLGGDFRQILPVLPKKGREDIVMASINKSYLWDDCKVFKLDKNMRIESGVPPVTISGQKIPYADWVIGVGDGHVPTFASMEGNEPCWIEIPPELNLCPENDGKKVIVDTIYAHMCESSTEADYFRDRAILTPLNEDVDAINKEVLKRFTGESRVYRSVDSICKSTVNCESLESMYPQEYLNSLKLAGIPNHELELKIGAPIVLLRNLAPNRGLCNGTRLVITQLCARVIEGVIITGNHVGEKAFIPRICMRPTDTTLPFTFKRIQFPVSLCYAMTINKSQGQTLKFVGLYLPRPVFSHGQFYVAISRVTTPLGLYIVCEKESHPMVGMTKNVVYHEVFTNL